MGADVLVSHGNHDGETLIGALDMKTSLVVFVELYVRASSIHASFEMI